MARNTEMTSPLLTQEVQVILPPVSYPRRVQVLVPDNSTMVHVGLDIPVPPAPSRRAVSAKQVGRNRVYDVPRIFSGAQIEITLMPGQWIVGAVENGMEHVTLIVEDVEG